MIYWMVPLKLAFDATRSWVCGVADGGGKLFAEGVGYFMMICDLAVLEGDGLAWRGPGLLVVHLGDEPPQWSGVLRAADGIGS